MSAIFSFCLEVRLSEHLSLKVQDEADNRNPDTIPRLCLPNHPISVTPICHFITFELIFVILFFSLKCFPGLEFPFNSGLKSYTLHNSNNNILAGSQQEHMGLSILMPRLASAKTFLCCHIDSSNVWDCWGIIPHSSGWGMLPPDSLCAQLRGFLSLSLSTVRGERAVESVSVHLLEPHELQAMSPNFRHPKALTGGLGQERRGYWSESKSENKNHFLFKKRGFNQSDWVYR